MEQSSRFQRLFDLIENGTSASTRSAAAEQIAEIYTGMPEAEAKSDFLDVLLAKVSCMRLVQPVRLVSPAGSWCRFSAIPSGIRASRRPR